MAKEKTAFLIYDDWETLFNSLDSNDEAGQLIKSLFAFAKRGEVAKFKGALKMAFIVMSQQISRDNKRYTIRCEKNKQIAIEREEQRRAERESDNTNLTFLIALNYSFSVKPTYCYQRKSHFFPISPKKKF